MKTLLAQPQLHQFLGSQELKQFKKGDKLLQPGEVNSTVVFIETGYLKVYMISKGGEEIVLTYLNPQAYGYLLLGVTGIFEDYYVEALSSVSAWKIPKSKFEDFSRSHQQLFADATVTYLKIIKGLYDQIICLKSGDSYARVAAIIYYLGKEFPSPTSQTTVDIKLTHQMIANLTGLTRETVTVQMNKLAKVGLINYNNKTLTINNNFKLQQETEFLD